MAKFPIIPNGGGDARYSGCPTFTGTYMKPGFLEFREIASATPIDWAVGDYVVYTRTGFTYRLYSVPQVKKQARATEYGGAFIYQGVQFYDDSKQLEICPFRDLVAGDNRIHFSTQPAISTFEAVDGIARRIQACLDDMYPDSWVVRVATTAMGASSELVALMAEPREFSVSGVSLLGALDKVYEVWPDVGWTFSYNQTTGKNVITIGGAGLSSTSEYQYGKGNGLRSITKNAANADELASRIFAYGSSRNMLPRWYNNKPIKDAESVDIQNLMIPISEWGETDDLPDPAKAYVEDATAQARLGLRPATVYFDGSGEYPEIYPSIRETTIGMVRDAIGDSTAQYYPSTTIYTDEDERIDTILSAPATFDSGLAGEEGKSSSVSASDVLGTLSGNGTVSPASNTSVILATRSYTMTSTRETDITVSMTGDGTITTQGGNGVVHLAISIQKGDGTTFDEVKRQLFELTPDGNNEYAVHSVLTRAAGVSVTAGDVIRIYLSAVIVNTNGVSSLSYSYSISSGINFSAAWSRKKVFSVSIRQVGFDIGAQAALGDGKTIAMRTGKCAGRYFTINAVQYDSSTDSWVLECYRSEDESLSQWFPNTDYPVEAGDEFVLLDIAMPDIYISMAEQRLLSAAQELLADISVERWQYVPEIDAKFMVENGRSILPAQNMVLTDVDIVGTSPESILIDTVTISEGEAAIPTYKVTLRDRKRKTFTEATGADGISSKSVGNATQDIESLLASQSVGESYFTLDANGNVTLKEQYQNLWVPGWLAAGGIGSGGSGGGGGLITSVKGVADLGTSIPTESLTETFSAKAIETIWEAVLDLQQGSNVSLVNGASYSTLTVNGTSAQLYTKAQVDGLIGNIEQFHYEIYASTSAVTNPQGNILYLIGPTGSGSDKYEEYVYANNSWTKIGDTTIDLSGYVQKVSGGTSGNFASLNSSGGIVDSGHKHGDYVTALGTSGNNLTWTKNGVTNNITVPYATSAGSATNATTASKLGSSTVGTAHKPIYLNAGTPTAVTDVSMDYIGWPIANHGSLGALDNLYYIVGPNVFASPNADYIDAEYSTNGGSTWVSFNATDAQKKALFTTSTGTFTIGNKGSSGVTTNDAARITVHLGVGAYCKCEFLAFRHYFPGQCDVKIEYTTYADTTTYVEHITLEKISSNPGYRVIPFSKFIFGNNGVHDLRITYRYNGTTYVNNSYFISEIRAYGSNVYSTPSTLARTGHVYAYDESLNVTFPAAVYANVNDSALGSTSKRWSLYATTGNFSGALTVSGNTTLSGTLTVGTASANKTTTLNGALNVAYGGATIKGTGNAVLNINGATASVDYSHLFVTGGSNNTRPLVLQNGYGNVGIGVPQPAYKLAVGGTFNATGAATLDSTLSVVGAVTLSGSTNTARRIYFGDTSHYLELDQYGFHFSHGVYSDGFVAAGGIGNGSGGGSATELGNLVDVSLSSTSNGDLLVYNSTTNHWENKPQSSIIPSVSISFNDLTSHPTTLGGYGITDANITNGVIMLGGNTITPLTSSDLSNYALKTGAGSYNFQVNSLILAGGTLTGPSAGFVAHRLVYTYTISGASIDDPVQTVQKTVAFLDDIPASLKNPYALTFGSKTYDGSSAQTLTASDLGALTEHQSLANYVTLDGTQTITGTKTFSVNQNFKGSLYLYNSDNLSGQIVASGYMVFRTGSAINLSDSTTYKQLTFHQSYGLYPEQSINLGYNSANGRWANIYGANGDLSGDLTLASTSHIDLGPARIEYDATTGAIHVTTNQTGNNAPTIGFYADGFIAAGGVGANGGGGGYGVESITSNQDGTVDFHFTGGDITTVDLNHTHEGLLPEVTSENNGKIMKVVDGEWALADESGGGGGSGYEVTSNKVTSLSNASTDTQYPSAKCVYDIVGNIETLLAAL